MTRETPQGRQASPKDALFCSKVRRWFNGPLYAVLLDVVLRLIVAAFFAGIAFLLAKYSSIQPEDSNSSTYAWGLSQGVAATSIVLLVECFFVFCQYKRRNLIFQLHHIITNIRSQDLEPIDGKFVSDSLSKSELKEIVSKMRVKQIQTRERLSYAIGLIKRNSQTTSENIDFGGQG